MDRSQVERRLGREREARRQAGDVEAWVMFRARERYLERLLEGWEERLHPRSRLGRWRDALASRVAGRSSTTLGTTPYLQRRDPSAPRPTFAQAAHAHKEPWFRALATEFKAEADRLAAEHKVTIVRGEANVGVFDGVFEPSYGVKVRGKKKNIDSFNEALGRRFDQKAVVGFTPHDPDGQDAEIQGTGGNTSGLNEDAFYRGLVDLMGDDAGASYDDGMWRVFVFHGDTEEGRARADAVADLMGRLGMTAKFVPGLGDYIPLREGQG